ncbi:MAG: PIG-L family deacetylase [Burkholderiales bacterium]|nr:PIG-L family deacetylase [Burkholderiales bacterium]
MFAKLVKSVVGIGLLAVSSLVFSQATPIGHIDRVVRENGQWSIYGWACQPGLGTNININVYIGGALYGFGPWVTNQPAEAAVHAQCGTSPSSGINYRFSIPYGSSVSGQTVRIDGIGTSTMASISGSNVYGFPLTDPESVIAAASRILLLAAHEDDEIVFSPMLARYCSTKSCRVVVATSSRTCHPSASEFVNSMASLPAVWDRGTFSSCTTTRTPQQVLNDWNVEAAGYGLTDMTNVIKLEIAKFSPDVILTFDPRHGTSCHPEHRAAAQAVINGVIAYPFDQSKVFLLTTRRIDVSGYSALTPAAPMDQFSAIYNAMDYIPAKSSTGWAYLAYLMSLYPTQFTGGDITAVQAAPGIDRTTAFLPLNKYIANDTRYTNSNANDSRIVDCGPF